MTPSPIKIELRWMIKRDLREVVAIDEISFMLPWSEQYFRERLKFDKALGMVAVAGGKVVGYMVFECWPEHLGLIKISVHPDYRHQGIGTELIKRLKWKLAIHSRKKIITVASSVDLVAINFFTALGFRVGPIDINAHQGNAEDYVGLDFTVDHGVGPMLERISDEEMQDRGWCPKDLDDGLEIIKGVLKHESE